MGVAEVALFLAIGAGLYFYNLQKAAGKLTYYPGDITAFEMQGLSPVLYAELVVQNTNNVSFTLNSLAGSVTVDGTLIGNVSNFTPVQINGNSQAVIPLTLVLMPIGIANEIIQIITGGAGRKSIKVSGSVNANGFQEEFSLDFKIGL